MGNFSQKSIKTMSARKKSPKKAAKKASHPSYKLMCFEAIAKNSHFGKGASRQSIAKYIQQNYGLEGGSSFNSALRRCLNNGMEAGIFEHGETSQRFKMTENGRSERKNANKPKPKSKAIQASKKKRKMRLKKKAPQKKKKKKKKKK